MLAAAGTREQLDRDTVLEALDFYHILYPLYQVQSKGKEVKL
jgi:hypothetical protein